MIAYLQLRLASILVGHLPERMGYRLFAMGGEVMYLVAVRTRRQVRQNLSRIMQESATEARCDARPERQVARAIFRNLLWGYYELFRLPRCDLDHMRARGVVSGLDQLEGKGRSNGSVVVFAHVGPLETLSRIPALLPEKAFAIVHGRMANQRVDAWFRRLRGSQGIRIVTVDHPYRIARLLRTGTNVIVCGDFDSTKSGIVVNFFGQPAVMPDGAVRLALSTGADLLLVEGWRDQRYPWRWGMALSEPIEIDRSGRSADHVRRGVQIMITHIERQIEARPNQWLPFRTIWEN